MQTLYIEIAKCYWNKLKKIQINRKACYVYVLKSPYKKDVNSYKFICNFKATALKIPESFILLFCK